MPDMRKGCRWSEGALAARSLFTTPEVTELTRAIKTKIGDFFRYGEGYHTTTIPFTRFACDFVLTYSFEEEIWIFDIVYIPPAGPQGPGPNKRGRRRNGYERVIAALFDDFRQFGEDWVGAAAALLYSIGPRIAAFCADVRVRQGFVGELKFFVTATHERFAPAAHICVPAAGRSSNAGGQVVQLVQKPLGTLLTFLGQMWAWERPLRRLKNEDLWDIAWFGAPPEASM